MAVRRGKTERRFDREGIVLLLYALPLVALVLVFSYVPLFGWSFAFLNYKPGLRLSQMQFVGLKYFEYMIRYNREILRALRNTLVLSALSTLAMALPVIFSVMLNELRSQRAKKLVQTFVTLPHFISWVVAGAMVKTLL
ncbi:MAG TPA: sugar ABC transporter permease, partial [Clostridia bacterium]|nr:sugar ABC transporter permease [Clostridia bacterium]